MNGIPSVLGFLSFFMTLGSIYGSASAEPQEYRFEAVSSLVDLRKSNLVKLRLVHRPSGRRIEGATVLESKLVMPMQGMGNMMSRATSAPVGTGDRENSSDYWFNVIAPMGGEWLLVLAARVPGETELVRGTVPIYVETRESHFKGRSTYSEENEEDER